MLIVETNLEVKLITCIAILSLLEITCCGVGCSSIGLHQSCTTTINFFASPQWSILDTYLQLRDHDKIHSFGLLPRILRRNVGEQPIDSWTIFNPMLRNSPLDFLTTVVYFYSNNIFLPEPQGIGTRLTGWLQYNIDILKRIVAVSCPTAEAFAETLFRIAFKDGNANMIEVLRRAFPEVAKAQMSRGFYGAYSPLEYAVYKEFVDLLAILIQDGVDVNATTTVSKDSALRMAARMGNPQIINMLLLAGAEVNARRRTTRIDACRMLLSAGADVNYRDRHDCTTLHTAIESYAPLEVNKFLVGAGVDLRASTCKGDNALDLALYEYAFDNDELIQYILEFDLAIQGALYATAMHTSSEDVLLRLDAGMFVDSYSGNGYTALTAAALKGDVELTRLLLRYGANANGCKGTHCVHGRAMTPLQSRVSVPQGWAY